MNFVVIDTNVLSRDKFGFDKSMVDTVLSELRDQAMMMETALGVDAAPWSAMQNEYDMLFAERNSTQQPTRILIPVRWQ